MAHENEKLSHPTGQHDIRRGESGQAAQVRRGESGPPLDIHDCAAKEAEKITIWSEMRALRVTLSNTTHYMALVVEKLGCPSPSVSDIKAEDTMTATLAGLNAMAKQLNEQAAAISAYL